MRFAVLFVIALPAVARGQSQPANTAAARQETFDKADAALAAGQRAEAIRILTGAAARTESVEILLRLARTQAAGGDATGAMQTLRQARLLAPNSEDVLRTQAEAALASRAPIAAVRALEPLTRMCPSVAQYRYLSGVARFQAGDAVAATEELEKARERAPDDALTLIALGLAHNARKQFAQAKPVLLHGLDLMPESADALAALAEAEEGLGELDAADGHAARALASHPRSIVANLALGMVRMQQKRYDEARAAFETAVAGDPASPKAHYQLSLAHERAGDAAAAERERAAYREALRGMEATLNELRSATGEGARETRH